MRTIAFGIFFAALAALLTIESVRADDRHRDRDRDRHSEHRDDGDDDHGRGRGGDRLRIAGPIDPAYANACGACHVPYPPALLPATAWRSILSGLDHHFGGENVSLDAGVKDKLERWILERARPDRRSGAPAALRVTEQPWFVDEHDELPRGVASRPEVKSMSNCAACHPGAASWDFDEHRVQLPRGQP